MDSKDETINARDGTKEEQEMSLSEQDGSFDLDDLIKKDAQHKRESVAKRREITLREYLDEVRENPVLAQSSPSRLLEIVQKYGVEPVPQEEQWLGVENRYSLISNTLFGVERPVEEFVKYLRAGANRLSTGKQVLLFVGPTASGKSTLANILTKALQDYRDLPVYKIKDCPMNEEPLHIVPRYMRRSHFNAEKAASVGLDSPIEDELGIGDIEGDLCHYCRTSLIGKKGKVKGKFVEDGIFEWWKVPVETFTFSVQGGRGIGSFEPSDEKSQDVGDLVGHENIGITANPERGRDDPESFRLDGELEKGNRGITEAREMLKKGIDERILWVFINVAEEKEIKVQGSNFPHISVDTVTIGHCNLTGYKSFASDQAHEALHDRIYVITFPYPLRVREEIKVYKKLIQEESNLFGELQSCHIAPGTLELAASFAILTRLKDSSMGVDRISKMRAYNGEKILAELQDDEKNPVDIESLLEEGQQDDDVAKREGMFGVSSRDILAALNMALVEQDGENACLTPLKAIRALRDVFEHRMGYSPEEVKEFMQLLSAEEGESVISLYKEWAVKQVGEAFLGAYSDLAEELADKYVEEVKRDRALKRKLNVGDRSNVKRDPISGKVLKPDERFMRSIEESWPIPVSKAEKDTHRGELLEYFGMYKDLAPYDYEPLRRAANNKILSDSRSSLILVLSTERPKDDQEKQRSRDLFDTLLEQDFCQNCARETVEKASEIINE